MMITLRSSSETGMRNILMEMRSSGELCDFTIKSGVYSVLAHKCILAATLEYFRTSFRFSEADTKETSIDLSHLNCEVEVIEKVVQSLYSQEIEVTAENVGGVLQVADYLMYNDLIHGIQEFMEKSLEISTAALYFQLCVQYGFDQGNLFPNICVLLSSRLHDYLIHQPSSLEWSIDVMETMLQYNLFDYCTPLQVSNFVLKKLQNLLLQAQLYGKEELNATSLSVLNFLGMYFTQLDKNLLDKWNSNIKTSFDAWMCHNSKLILDLENVQDKLKTFQNLTVFKDNSTIEKRKMVTENSFIHDRQLHNPSSKPNSSSSVSQHLLHCQRNKSFSYVLKGSDSVEIVCSAQNPDSPDSSPDNLICFAPCNASEDASVSHLNDKPSFELPAPDGPRNISLHDTQSERPFYSQPNEEASSTHCLSDPQTCETPAACDGLVVLSPSHEMLSQLMELEAGTARPLLRSPQLSLHFYDIGSRMWKSTVLLDFPVHGHMLEKHAWRMAFVKKSLFLFSLTKKKGLEYNTETKQWSELSCENVFKPHVNSEVDDDGVATCFPVKSVIPVSMEDSLVVVSMSREPRQDRSFWTQQHIYQWDPKTRTLDHVTCVRDSRMDLPATKWTVDGDTLVTVKASTMMFGDLHMYNIQHIHIYNAKSKQLETHHMDCAMKSGLKVFLQNKKLYLLNNFGEYKVYDLETKELTDWIKILNSSRHINCGDPGLEIGYPAGIRTTCHAGSSRWALNSNFNVWSASLSEIHVDEKGEFFQHIHPNPPFQYMTSMCSARLDRKQMDSLEQAIFRLPTMQNQ